MNLTPNDSPLARNEKALTALEQAQETLVPRANEFAESLHARAEMAGAESGPEFAELFHEVGGLLGDLSEMVSTGYENVLAARDHLRLKALVKKATPQFENMLTIAFMLELCSADALITLSQSQTNFSGFIKEIAQQAWPKLSSEARDRERRELSNHTWLRPLLKLNWSSVNTNTIAPAAEEPALSLPMHAFNEVRGQLDEVDLACIMEIRRSVKDCYIVDTMRAYMTPTRDFVDGLLLASGLRNEEQLFVGLAKSYARTLSPKTQYWIAAFLMATFNPNSISSA